MSEVPHVLIAFAVAWSVLLLLLTAVAFLALLRMRAIEKGATSSNDLESNREYQVLNKLALPLGTLLLSCLRGHTDYDLLICRARLKALKPEGH